MQRLIGVENFIYAPWNIANSIKTAYKLDNLFMQIHIQEITVFLLLQIG